MTFGTPSPPSRWPRGHRFALSTQGLAAEAEYRSQIELSRTAPGRAAFDTARNGWATSFKLQADDGLYLIELARTTNTLAAIVAALETCGKNRRDALSALGRLADAGMLQ